VLQAEAGPVSDTVTEDREPTFAPPRSLEEGRDATVSWRRITAATIVFAGVGWGLAGFEHFVAVPRAENTARVAYALDLVDRFDDTPAHRAYVELASDMKPWWDEISDLQHRIQTTRDDTARDALITERDASLVAFVESRGLAAKVDLLVGSFDTFTRCLLAAVCDEGIVEQAISIDVKRIWRTFRPWVLHRRGAGEADRAYGRDLEDLYFRFVG
jgi:hypothetical protein